MLFYACRKFGFGRRNDRAHEIKNILRAVLVSVLARRPCFHRQNKEYGKIDGTGLLVFKNSTPSTHQVSLYN